MARTMLLCGLNEMAHVWHGSLSCEHEMRYKSPLHYAKLFFSISGRVVGFFFTIFGQILELSNYFRLLEHFHFDINSVLSGTSVSNTIQI